MVRGPSLANSSMKEETIVERYRYVSLLSKGISSFGGCLVKEAQFPCDISPRNDFRRHLKLFYERHSILLFLTVSLTIFIHTCDVSYSFESIEVGIRIRNWVSSISIL